MTKEEVLALCANDAEKQRVEATYVAADKFKKESSFTSLTTEEEVKNEIQVLVLNYTKRLEAKARKAAKAKANEPIKIQFDFTGIKQAINKASFDELEQWTYEIDRLNQLVSLCKDNLKIKAMAAKENQLKALVEELNAMGKNVKLVEE